MESYPEANGTMHYESRSGFLIEDWDLCSLRVGEAIVCMQGVPPFTFRFDLFK